MSIFFKSYISDTNSIKYQHYNFQNHDQIPFYDVIILFQGRWSFDLFFFYYCNDDTCFTVRTDYLKNHSTKLKNRFIYIQWKRWIMVYGRWTCWFFFQYEILFLYRYVSRLNILFPQEDVTITGKGLWNVGLSFAL